MKRREFMRYSVVAGSVMAAGADAAMRKSRRGARAVQSTVDPNVPPGEIVSFTTGGHTVYHLQPATVKAGERAIIAAAYDGAVMCFTPEGKPLWQARTGGFFPFDLAVGDLDGDGLDETLVASADGKLYAFDHDGSRMWVFEKTPPLFQVCIARLAGGASVILTGGVEEVLYKLSPKGELLQTLKAPNCIRHLRAGNILGEGRDFAAIATTSGGLYGRLSLLLVDPADLTVRWTKANLGTAAFNSGKRFFSMVLVDLDKDGRDEILLSNSWGEHGRIYAFNQQGKQLFTTTDDRIPNIPYRMNLLRHVKLADDDFVLGHFGNVLIVYNLDGSCREVLEGSYSYADGVFDPVNKTWYMGSEVSGGDEIIALRLDKPGWKQAYGSVKSTGRLAEIERNQARLREQIAAFNPPPYQPAPRDVAVFGRRSSGKFQHISFISTVTWSQKFTDRGELWCQQIDGRRRYDMTVEEIVAAAKEMEAAGRDFLIWSGHGGAVHFPLITFEKMLDAAPRHLWGFEFAEMGDVDAHMEEVLEKILLPLAERCRARGKHILFRNKNIFWSGTCYVPFWRKMLLNEKYQDVFVPALEETNSRTQELSLAGRVGLWQTGSFNRWSCHAVTDNANFDRMWEYAGQQLLTHHFRQLVSTAALGADLFYNSLSNNPLAGQLTPFFDMLEKGIIHIPAREELLSLSEVSLGMQSPPDPVFIEHGINGNAYTYPRDEQPPQMVFDRLDGYWAGTPLQPHDFSRYAMNLDRRMCNFLPENPYGLVPIVPADLPPGKRPGKTFVTDGRYFYEDGARREAAEMRPKIEAALREAADKLPVRVAGPAHWAVARLDPTHVRVTLIDPGYLDPAQREVEIVLQHLEGTAAMDILSGEKLDIGTGRLKLRIPAGTVRIVDIQHQ